MMSNQYVIGLDFGTDSVRALLVDEQGHERSTAVHEYRRWKEGKYCDAGTGRYRQHPLDYLEGLDAVVRGVLSDCDHPEAVRGIGVDTTGSTPCVVDASGKPLSLSPAFEEDPDAMFVLWKDHTAIAEADEITRAARQSSVDYTQYSGGTYSAEWYWNKLLHILRTHDTIRQKAVDFVEHCDWIPSVLTGQPVKRSRCAAGHKAMWHEAWGGYPPVDFFHAIDERLDCFRGKLEAATYTADVPVGMLSHAWARQWGLTDHVVVSGGAIDCHVGAVGAGIQPRQLVKIIGTSTCDVMVVPPRTGCIHGICGQVNGSVLPGETGLEAGQSAFGDIFAWFVRFLSYSGKTDIRALERDASALSDSPVMALDWLNGRRSPDTDARLTGGLWGLTLGTTAPMVYRALVESAAFGSRAIVERLQDEGIDVQSILATGGISHKSPFCMQMLSDVLQRPVHVTRSTQTCALGAAMMAAAACGIYPTVAAASAAMQQGIETTYFPQRNVDRRYADYQMAAKMAETFQHATH